MANRRQFIQSGVALSALSSPAVSTLASGFGATEPRTLRLDRFVIDERFAEAVEIAQHASLRGIPVARISGDLTDLWYDDLDLRWKQAPRALGGVTTHHGLFVLETLAADHRMSVVYRGEHGVPRDGLVDHALSGPEDLVARAAIGPDGSDPNGAGWRSLLGRAMTECPMGRPAAGRLDCVTSAHRTSSRDEPLYSWIIAPRSAVAPMA